MRLHSPLIYFLSSPPPTLFGDLETPKLNIIQTINSHLASLDTFQCYSRTTAPAPNFHSKPKPSPEDELFQPSRPPLRPKPVHPARSRHSHPPLIAPLPPHPKSTTWPYTQAPPFTPTPPASSSPSAASATTTARSPRRLHTGSGSGKARNGTSVRCCRASRAWSRPAAARRYAPQ